MKKALAAGVISVLWVIVKGVGIVDTLQMALDDSWEVEL